MFSYDKPLKLIADYEAECAIVQGAVIDITKNEKPGLCAARQEAQKIYPSDKTHDRTALIEDKVDNLADSLTEFFLAFLKKTEKDEERQPRDLYKSDWDCSYCGKPGHGAANYYDDLYRNSIRKRCQRIGHLEATYWLKGRLEGMENLLNCRLSVENESQILIHRRKHGQDLRGHQKKRQ